MRRGPTSDHIDKEIPVDICENVISKYFQFYIDAIQPHKIKTYYFQNNGSNGRTFIPKELEKHNKIWQPVKMQNIAWDFSQNCNKMDKLRIIIMVSTGIKNLHVI